MILEGAYPYIRGGVSSWAHELIAAQAHLRFHLLIIVAPDTELNLRYELPANVCGLTHFFVPELPRGPRWLPGGGALVDALQVPVAELINTGDPDALRRVIELLRPWKDRVGSRQLLDSKPAWRSFNTLYQQRCTGASFLNSFWAWRTLVGGLYSMLMSPLPAAKTYHCISTGYAGLVAARASLETGRPAIVTEHGVYTNERRLEILAAPWLAVDDSPDLSVAEAANAVKQLWIDTFVAYSRACYAACAQVITLFEGNYPLQLEDGANPDRLCVIPNGIDPQLYENMARPTDEERRTRRPLIALVGRVVPIKDIKTFIRACSNLRARVPNVLCYILGPMDEDPAYARACRELVDNHQMQGHIEFKGMVNLVDYYGQLDVMVLTSISEAQPLVILEAGVAGVPSVATDVGACRELIHGRSDEVPALGDGGQVVPIGDPLAIADAIAELLEDEEKRRKCGEVMQKRVRQSYDKRSLQRRYAQLYGELIDTPTAPHALAAEG